MFVSGDYEYRKKGESLEVTPIIASGELHDLTKKPIFRFSILDENTLREEDTGVIYRRQE